MRAIDFGRVNKPQMDADGREFGKMDAVAPSCGGFRQTSSPTQEFPSFFSPIWVHLRPSVVEFSSLL
jgi:hypothetical protein